MKLILEWMPRGVALIVLATVVMAGKHPVRAGRSFKYGVVTALGVAVCTLVGTALYVVAQGNKVSDTGGGLLIGLMPPLIGGVGYFIGALLGLVLPVPETHPRKASAPPPGAG